MSTDTGESKPLPGLPKVIFFIQVGLSLLEEVRDLLHRIHQGGSPGGEENKTSTGQGE